MASIRNLKKDLSYIASEVVAECYFIKNTHPEITKKDIEELLGEITQMYVETISRANHPDGKNNRKIVKTYYDTLIKDFLIRSEAVLAKLEKLQ